MSNWFLLENRAINLATGAQVIYDGDKTITCKTPTQDFQKTLSSKDKAKDVFQKICSRIASPYSMESIT